ncbi:MAG: hypothetical protein R3A48_14050 [Polyangiales bacterium]
MFGATPELTPPGSHAPAVLAATATLAAMGAVYARVEAPRCGGTRIDEVRAHAPAIRRALQRGSLAVDEVLLAAGLIPHARTEITSGGAIAEVSEAPVRAPEPEVESPRAPPELTPSDEPPASPRATRGAVRRVQPTPAPRPGGRRAVLPRSHEF